MAHYKSQVTQFLEELKKQKPELELEQKKGRDLLWDREKLNLDEYERKQKATIKQKAYVYGTE